VGTGQANPKDVVECLRLAMNAHDLEAHVACMHPDYRSARHAHPNRGFGGREQVKKNWTAIYGAISDFHAELLALTTEGDTVWAEWHWTGTRADGSPFAMRGVTIFGVADDHIAWGRLYMEEVEEAGEDIDQAVIGGTGRFQGAEGTLTGTGTVDLVGSTVTAAFKGTINKEPKPF
jgi:ketosteroid isomerase-like protein